MNHDHDNSTAAVFGKLIVLITAWLGSVTLADVQVGVSIVSGLAVLTYTVIKIIKELRGKA